PVARCGLCRGARARGHRLPRGDRLAPRRCAQPRRGPTGEGAMSRAPRIVYRSRPRPSDVAALRRLVAATGVFYREERAVALELLELRLVQGAKSGYEFLFAERGGELLGYCAFGRVPLTQASYDLYWIAVAPAAQG